jgi:aspartate aminotransferase, chloroplastic
MWLRLLGHAACVLSRLQVRHELRAALEQRMPDRDWSFVTSQIGMFSFTGMTPSQVDNMTQKHAVFMTRDGRISLAGLSSAKVDYLADAIVDSVKNVSRM